MFVLRDKTKNDLRAHSDKVNYALRQRIYDTERIKNELEWQKWNVRQTFLILIISIIFYLNTINNINKLLI